MTLGVEVRSRTAKVARGIPVNTGRWFVGGKAASGSTTEAVGPLRSISDFAVEYGPRAVANQSLYDAVETYFGEGGKEVFVGRHVNNPPDALALFDPDLGPGQVSIVGEADNLAVQSIVLAHARSTNRIGIVGVNQGDTVAEMDTLGDAMRAQSDVEYGGLFGPWVVAPAPAGVVGGTTRTISPEPVVAALCARVDAEGNVNRAAAGRDFPLQYCLGFETTIGKADREALLNAGVNTFAEIFNVLELYGFQTAKVQAEEDPYWQLNCSRMRMFLKGQAQAKGEPYVFRTMDGQGRLAGALKGEIDEVCLLAYQSGGLFGNTPQEAFSVEVGAAINTIPSIAQGELHAVLEAKLSLHAKAVIIDLVTIPVTGQVSQP